MKYNLLGGGNKSGQQKGPPCMTSQTPLTSYNVTSHISSVHMASEIIYTQLAIL